MPLRLIVGPPNSGRAGEVRRRLTERAHDEPILVVPTGDDAAWFERELCSDGGAALGISIRTFGWLFEDLAADLGLGLPPQLNSAERVALVRATVASADLGRLRRSAGRPGFVPALDALIEELQAALVAPEELAERAAELDDGEHELEIAALYRAYTALRDEAGRSDRGALAAAVLVALRAGPAELDPRPLFLYGFDDLTVAQRELVGALSETSEVTVAVNFADRRSLNARATLLQELTDELGGEREPDLEPEEAGHSAHASLRHLDRQLFEPGAGIVPPDGAIRLLECAGERGEAEAIGAEVAALLHAGTEPAEIAIVVRHPSSAGPVIASVLGSYGIPVALAAHAAVAATAVGRALITLCRAAGPGGTAEDLLAHLRADPDADAAVADWAERDIRRGKAVSAEDLYRGWRAPPRHLARLQAAAPGERLAALALIARELAESAHRGEAPLAASSAGGEPGTLHPLELRAAVAAAELLEELASLGALPGHPEPGLVDAIEALESASVPTWRGPTDERVRILSPYRLRAGRASYLFCAGLQDGVFPSPAAPDPLLGDDRRKALGISSLVRREQADEERYLFHACVSRPTERLYLSWQSCNDEGTALARSPFVDEVLDLLGEDPADVEEAMTERRGLDQVVQRPARAPSERELARSLAARRNGDAALTLAEIGVEGALAERVSAAVAAARAAAPPPDPLAVPRVLAELGGRDVLSANQLEGWMTCSYRWFVDHELSPQRLEDEGDPLWLGSVAHNVLERLYREAPGEDSIPRKDDLERWQGRLDELLDEEVAEARMGAERIALLARLRAQLHRFLADEATSETVMRPDPELLERAFGVTDSDEAEPDTPALRLAEFSVRGRIDRIDLAPDGRGALVRDYKTSSSVTPAARFGDEASLQVQIYALAAQELLELDVIGGLYQPLGGTKDRRPRGLVMAGDSRLDGVDVVRTDRLDAEEFSQHLEHVRSEAARLGTELRAGRIDRDPLGGTCPTYCTFQPICRLERSIGLPTESNGKDED